MGHLKQVSQERDYLVQCIQRNFWNVSLSFIETRWINNSESFQWTAPHTILQIPCPVCSRCMNIPKYSIYQNICTCLFYYIIEAKTFCSKGHVIACSEVFVVLFRIFRILGRFNCIPVGPEREKPGQQGSIAIRKFCAIQNSLQHTIEKNLTCLIYFQSKKKFYLPNK